MWIPFHDELDETFQSDRSIWVKIIGCSFATIFVVLVGTYRFHRDGDVKFDLTPGLIGLLGTGSAVLGAMIGLALSLKDTVEQRLERRDPVNPLLKLYFGGGTRCVVTWFFSVIFGGMVITLAEISMGLW